MLKLWKSPIILLDPKFEGRREKFEVIFLFSQTTNHKPQTTNHKPMIHSLRLTPTLKGGEEEV